MTALRQSSEPQFPSNMANPVRCFAMNLFYNHVSWFFILFRFFDIVKPWPISYLDKHCDGGAGIMIDDIIAGFMALGCMHLIF